MRDEPYVDILRVTRLAHVCSPGVDSRKFELRPVISTTHREGSCRMATGT